MSCEFGRPAPRWLAEAEVFNGWYSEWTDEVLNSRLKGFPLIIGAPHSKEWIEKAHERGPKVLPYVSFYKALNVAEARGADWPDVMKFTDSPFCAALDLGQHPEWMLYNEAGKVPRPFESPNYRAGWEQLCANSPGVHEAAIRGVHALMQLGADGLFIDNIYTTKVCHGPTFGKHTHVSPEKTNTEAFEELIGKVYEHVKSFGADKVVVQNPGLWQDWGRAYPRFADAIMIESYICTSASERRWNSWEDIRRALDERTEAMRHGKVIVALSYLGHTPLTVEDDAFYCFACAKLSGFLWADWFTMPVGSSAQELFRVRLGRPSGEMEERDGVFFRRFECGLVVVNPGRDDKEIMIPLATGSALRDLYADRILALEGGMVPVQVPGRSGRVYLLEA
jgi:hypothetical protein